MPSDRSRILTIPNVISLIRLALVPVFFWLLVVADEPVAAGLLFAIIGATDWIDGYLARRLGQVSALGEFLDPLADRFAVAVALIGGLVQGYLPAWFGGALLLREIGISLGAVYLGVFVRVKLDVRRIGKLATLLVYASVAWLIIGIGGDIEWIEWLGWIAGIPGLVLYYYSAIMYAADARRVMAEAGEEAAGTGTNVGSEGSDAP